MKQFNTIKRLTAGFAVALATFFIATASASAIPYTGPTTPGLSAPAFNVFTGVPAPWGNENDFLRARVDDGSTTDYSDPLLNSCNNGTEFQLRVYVHNGAGIDGNNGGNGPSVAHDTKVKVDLKNGSAKSIFSPLATISASNAGSVSDATTINCNGKTVKLNYVANSASQYSKATGVVPLSDQIVGSGVEISSHNVPGDVWGCWDERVYVVLSVKVEVVPVVPPVSTAACKLDNGAFVVTDDRKVTVKVNATVKNATVVGYQINWGDGSAVSNKQTDTHQYPTDKDGTYDIQARVKVKLADGSEKWVDGVDCAKTVKFTSNQPPVVPPVTPTVVVPPSGQLPDTGMNVFGIFATVSMIGAFLHKAYKARKATV
ncbi:hypothetical protein KC946_03140 [Candidatus Saccharibacteria bacterium]|nr:hypothetical protein [Candidatus Saccharibacteria bacterium]